MFLRCIHRLPILAVLALLSVPATGLRADPGPVEWRGDFESGLQEAVLLRRPLLLTFHTDWCGWCRKLEASTFKAPEFLAAARGFVPVRVNGDRERGLVTMFRVSGYPTTILLDRHGRELGRVVGYKGPGPYAKFLYAAMGRRESLEKVTARAERHPESADALYDLGDVQMALGRYAEARDTFRRLQTLPGGGASDRTDDAQLDLALAVYLSGKVAEALPLFESYLERYGDGSRGDQGHYFYGLALLDAGRRKAGRAELREAARVTDMAYIRSATSRLIAE